MALDAMSRVVISGFKSSEGIARYKVKGLRVGFVPGSDAELLAGIPIMRELRKRGNTVKIALSPDNPSRGLQQGILEMENEETVPFQRLKGMDLDILLFDSRPLRRGQTGKRFGFNMVSGLTTHDRDKFRNIYLFGEYNLGAAPSSLPEHFHDVYPWHVPVIGMPTVDLHRTRSGVRHWRKYFLYPDSAPFKTANRRWLFSVLENLAHQFPDIDFRIKERFHSDKTYNHVAYAPYRSMLTSNTPKNLLINSAEDSTWELIEGAQGLIGIHSGALWQGLLRGKPVAMIADPPEERVNGTLFSEGEILSNNSARVFCRDLPTFISAPWKVPRHVLRQEVPYDNASSRIVDVFESIFTRFAGDRRLPWIKFDFKYDDAFDAEIEKIGEKVRGKSIEALKWFYSFKAEVSGILSEGVTLTGLLNGRVKPRDISEYFKKCDLFGSLKTIFRGKGLKEMMRRLPYHRNLFLSRCIHDFYEPGCLEEGLADTHVITESAMKYGYYIYLALRKTDAREAEKYRARLRQRYRMLQPHSDDASFSDNENRRLVTAFFENSTSRREGLTRNDALEALLKPKLDNMWRLSYAESLVIIDTCEKLIKISIEDEDDVLFDTVEGILSDLNQLKGEGVSIFVDVLHLLDDQLKAKEQYLASRTILEKIAAETSVPPALKRMNTYRLASLFVKTGEFEKAVTLFETIDTTELPLRYRFGRQYHLGDCKYRLGDRPSSLVHINRCLALCPEHKKALALKSRLVHYP